MLFLLDWLDLGQRAAGSKPLLELTSLSAERRAPACTSLLSEG